MDIDFQPAFDLTLIKQRKPDMWRYREAIPLGSDTFIATFDEGFTPLTEIMIDRKVIFIKQDPK